MTSISWYGLNSAVRVIPCDRSSVVTFATATVVTGGLLAERVSASPLREQEDVRKQPEHRAVTSKIGLDFISSAMVAIPLRRNHTLHRVFLGPRGSTGETLNDLAHYLT